MVALIAFDRPIDREANEIHKSCIFEKTNEGVCNSESKFVSQAEQLAAWTASSSGPSLKSLHAAQLRVLQDHYESPESYAEANRVTIITTLSIRSKLSWWQKIIQQK